MLVAIAPGRRLVPAHDIGKIPPGQQLAQRNFDEMRRAHKDSGAFKGRPGLVHARRDVQVHQRLQTRHSGRFWPLSCHAGKGSAGPVTLHGWNSLDLLLISAIITASNHAVRTKAQDEPQGRELGRLSERPQEAEAVAAAQPAGAICGAESGSVRGRRIERPRKTIGYVRVSTQEQAQSGFSLSAQRGKIESFAHATAREPIDEVLVDDGFSGSSLERPAMTDLLERIERREIAAVIVTKLDRLSRNLRDILDVLERCQRTDTALLSASESLDTSSAVGRMAIHMLGSFAEFERGRVAERTSDVLGHRRKSRKVYCARTPFGYRRDGDNLVAVPEEQSALEEMRRMHSAGDTYSAIAAMLEARGIAPRGAKWYPSSVRAVLQSKMNREVAA